MNEIKKVLLRNALLKVIRKYNNIPFLTYRDI